MILRAANDSEKRQRDLASYEAWGAPLPIEAWVEREARLRSHRWAQQAMTTWLLCGDAGEILASCETFQVASRVGGVPGTSYGVASVYTERALRGRGHATRLLTLLSEELKRRDPTAQSAFLFSDVGAAIYRRCGYVERPAFDWVIVPGNAPRDPEVSRIDERDLGAALDRIPPPAAPLTAWPSEAQLDWHLERERIYAQALRRPRPRHAGAMVGKSTALWSAVIRSNELVVLLLDARSPRDAERLLRTAATEAHQAGLTKVRVWETPGLPRLSGVAERTPREGSLPMVCALNPAASPEGWRTIPRALWL